MSTSYRYISTADTAKLAREALKAAFPGTKFSVKSKSYSGGSSIRVNWVDGPTAKEVEAVAGHFHGASFDGMQDLKEYHNSELNGETVAFAADYIFFNRDFSREFLTKCVQEACAEFGLKPVEVITSEYGSSYISDEGEYAHGSHGEYYWSARSISLRYATSHSA